MVIEPDFQRIAAGDRQAFAALVEQYQRPLFGFLGRMGLDQAAAEDIAQEAFLRTWANRAAFRPERASFITWLFTIARNLALNAASRHSARREAPFDDATPDIACDRPTAFDQITRRQGQDRLRAALRALPSADRTLLALAYVEDLSHADIARIEGCSSGAIKQRAHRAKQKLRGLLEADNG
jgi:RNA polymerase sigma-70 factor (ECF subfamily)